MKVEKQDHSEIVFVLKSEAKPGDNPGDNPEFVAVYTSRQTPGTAALRRVRGNSAEAVGLEAEGWRRLAKFASDVAEHLDASQPPRPLPGVFNDECAVCHEPPPHHEPDCPKWRP